MRKKHPPNPHIYVDATKDAAEAERPPHDSFERRQLNHGVGADDGNTSALNLLEPLPADANMADKFLHRVHGCQESMARGRYVNRILIAVMAVSLLWLTSLAVVRAIVLVVIVGPDLSKVIALSQASIDKTNFYYSAYEVCATRYISGCQVKMNQSIEAENAALIVAQELNQRIINESYDIKDNCSLQVGWTVGAFQVMQYSPYNILNPLTEFPMPNTTVDPRCSMVNSLLQGNAGAIQAYGSSDRYQASASSQISSTTAAIEAIGAYNQQYQQNKSQQIQEVSNNLQAINLAQGILYSCRALRKPPYLR